jgi:putative Ca2+/H+ antiporter (TMEM165/GDT1 family)
MARPRKDSGVEVEPAHKAGQPKADTKKTDMLIEALLAHFIAEYGDRQDGIVKTLKALRG